MAIVKLINMRYANKEMTTGFGKLVFNESGEVSVEQEVADALKELKGFSVNEDESEQEDEETLIDGEDTAEATESEEMSESEQQEEESAEDEQEEKTEDDTSEELNEEGSEGSYTYEELDALNVAQLKKIATEDGIDIKNLTKKAQLISAILE